MRSSVSYILSHAPGESIMSHPDYGQHAQHHACLLVLVKGIGGMLKNFNKQWERIQRVNNIKVTGLYCTNLKLEDFQLYFYLLIPDLRTGDRYQTISIVGTFLKFCSLYY